jgi:WD40 repeat protein
MQLIDGGRFLATAEGMKLRTWDLVTNERLCNVEYGSTDINGIVQLKSGVLGTTRANHDELKLWDTNTCEKIQDIELGDYVEKKTWLQPINEKLVAIGFEKSVKVFDLENEGNVVAELDVDEDLTDLDASSKYLFAANEDGFVYVYDINNNFEEVIVFRALKLKGDIKLRLRVVSDSRVVTWYKDEMCVWNEFKSEGCFANNEEFKNAQVLKDYTSVNATQGAILLLTSSDSGYISVWDLTTRTVLSERQLSSSGKVSFVQLDKNVLYPAGNLFDQ